MPTDLSKAKQSVRDRFRHFADRVRRDFPDMDILYWLSLKEKRKTGKQGSDKKDEQQ